MRGVVGGIEGSESHGPRLHPTIGGSRPSCRPWRRTIGPSDRLRSSPSTDVVLLSLQMRGYFMPLIDGDVNADQPKRWDRPHRTKHEGEHRAKLVFDQGPYALGSVLLRRCARNRGPSGRVATHVLLLEPEAMKHTDCRADRPEVSVQITDVDPA